MSKKLLILMLLAAFCVVSSFAQVGQTGSMKGTVTSKEDGIALPGVTVALRSPALMGTMTAVTSDKGLFRFSNLNPGLYEVTFEIAGFATEVRRDFMVNANMTYTIDIQMETEKLVEAVTVVGTAPTIDRQTVAKVTTFGGELLQSLPRNRNLDDYVNMIPGITGGKGDYISSMGASVRDNAYNIDGVSANDHLIGTSGFSMVPESVEEISVQTGGVTAESSGGAGAVINVVTRSGGNDFSGSVQAFYTHESLKSDNTGKTGLSVSGAKFEMEPGFNLGGPIVKDKIWFYTNFSYFNTEVFMAGYPADDPDNPVPMSTKSINSYTKLTFQATQKDKIILGVNLSNRKRDSRGADVYSPVSHTYKDEIPRFVLSAQWVHTFSANLFSAFKWGLTSSALNLYAKNNEGELWDQDLYRYVGGGVRTDELNPRYHMQTNLDTTAFIDDFMGSHELKFGAQVTYSWSAWDTRMQGPADEHGFNRTTWARGPNWWDNWAEYDMSFKKKFDLLNVGLFVNDAWTIGKRLTLNWGVRYDIDSTVIPKTKQGDVATPEGDLGFLGHPEIFWNMQVDKNITAYTWKSLSPRIGVVYDLFGDGKTLLKANFANYHQSNYGAIADELHPVGWAYYWYYYDPAVGPDTVYYFGGAGMPGVDTQASYKNWKLKAPYTNELVLSVERELMKDLSVGARYIRRWERDIIVNVNAAQLDMDKLMETGELDWTNWTQVPVVDPLNGNTVTMWTRKQYKNPENYIVNAPGADRNYTGVELTLKKRYSNRWEFELGYTYSKSEGLIANNYYETAGWPTSYYENPNTHVNAFGRMPYERTHQLKIQTLVKGPWGINVSSRIEYLSGYPYSRSISSAYLSGYSIYPTASVFAEKRGAFSYPNQLNIDARLEKTFKFSEKMSISAFCDIFNVLNANKTTQVYTTSNNPGRTFELLQAIQDPRIFRFGARFEF